MTKTATITKKQIDIAIKLDIGCGINKQPDHIGVDRIKFEGVDVVLDVVAKNGKGFKKWPWKDNSVESVHCSHFLEHLEADERIHFVNELYRILKPNGTVQVVVPHWASCRAYGDLTHKWPPVSEMFWFYLSKEWRATNAPHNDFYTCDFDATWGYSMHPDLTVRNQETQNFAMQNYKEAVQDMISTLTKKPNGSK